MNKLIASSKEQFAIIESRWADRRPERFVLAYCDEASLRELIAARSIVAVGLRSRGDAIKKIETYISSEATLQHVRKTTQVLAGSDQRGVRCATQKMAGGLFFAETTKLVRRILQHAVAAAILIFYSRNTASAAIRAFIGA